MGSGNGRRNSQKSKPKQSTTSRNSAAAEIAKPPEIVTGSALPDAHARAEVPNETKKVSELADTANQWSPFCWRAALWFGGGVAMAITLNSISGNERSFYLVLLVIVLFIPVGTWKVYVESFHLTWRTPMVARTCGFIALLVCGVSFWAGRTLIEDRAAKKATAESNLKKQGDELNETLCETRNQNNALNAAVSELSQQNETLVEQNANFARQSAEMQNILNSHSATLNLISDEEATQFQRRYPLGCHIYSLYQPPHSLHVKSKRAKTIVFPEDGGINYFLDKWMDEANIEITSDAVTFGIPPVVNPSIAFVGNAFTLSRIPGTRKSIITTYVGDLARRDQKGLFILQEEEEFDPASDAYKTILSHSPIVIQFEVYSATKQSCLMVLGIKKFGHP